jgi:dTDP-4-amino-4,6-dideoxygalactose transaminase
MSLSFQYQKHLSLGRGGAILCSNQEEYISLKKLSYDGRLPNVPWRDQNIESFGLHYYMTPETAQMGVEKFDFARSSTPKKWIVTDWPDLSLLKVLFHFCIDN